MRKLSWLLMAWVVACMMMFISIQGTITGAVIGVKDDAGVSTIIFFFTLLAISIAILFVAKPRNIEEMVRESDQDIAANDGSRYLLIDTGGFTDLYRDICRKSGIGYDRPFKGSPEDHPLYDFLKQQSMDYEIILTSEVKKELEHQRDVKKRDDKGGLLTPPIILNTLYSLMGEGAIKEVDVSATSEDREEIARLNKDMYKSGQRVNSRIGDGDVSIVAYAKIFGRDGKSDIRIISPDSDVLRLMNAYSTKYNINSSCDASYAF
jgi:hypothetical protein